MEEITIIIPVHEYNEVVDKYLRRAIESVTNQTVEVSKVIIITTSDIEKQISGIEGVEFLINKGQLDYCSQINLAVKSVKTKYFSILELDDAYSKNWVKNVQQYIKSKPDFSIFLPIVKYVDAVEGKEIGSINEIAWVGSFSTQIGVIDNEVLKGYSDFSTCGGVFRTSDFIEVGGLKPSIKLSFWYEFLLRATDQSVKVMVMPKSGYTHTANRKDSLSESYKEMSNKERAWWVKLAQKEYFFKKERVDKAKYEAK